MRSDETFWSDVNFVRSNFFSSARLSFASLDPAFFVFERFRRELLLEPVLLWAAEVAGRDRLIGIVPNPPGREVVEKIVEGPLRWCEQQKGKERKEEGFHGPL